MRKYGLQLDNYCARFLEFPLNGANVLPRKLAQVNVLRIHVAFFIGAMLQLSVYGAMLFMPLSITSNVFVMSKCLALQISEFLRVKKNFGVL